MLPSGIPVSDIYAVGFQEIVDLNAVNVAMDSKSQSNSKFWQEKLSVTLNNKSGTRFRHIYSQHLVGILLCIFAKESVAPYIQDVRYNTVGVGLMGMMGNKGGVSIRLKLYDSSICFVSSHLAAHRENVSGRNSDVKNILERTVLDGDEALMTEKESNRPKYGDSLSEGKTLSILQHDFVFWLGDLNYRIEEGLSTEEIFAKIEQGNIAYLSSIDQLNLARARGEVFQGFEEGLITFMPTYKYQPGTDGYDTRPEKKIRAPAWCDRILWKEKNGGKGSASEVKKIKQLNYCRAELQPSDHKPVSSTFECQIRVVTLEKEKTIHKELLMSLEYWANAGTPSVEVLGNIINLPDIRYQIRASSVMTLQNQGATLVYWRFVTKLEEKRKWKRWLSVKPSLGLLLPGEAAEITVSITVDRQTAVALMNATEFLDDILILRVENGLDYYVNVTGQYLRSCYGMPLEELVLCTEPVRTIPLPAELALEGLSTPQTPAQIAASALAIPKEMWRLVDSLSHTHGTEKNLLYTEGLFCTPGSIDEVIALREQLDTGAPFTKCSVHSVVEALVSFVTALPVNIIPLELLPTAEIELQSLRQWSRNLLGSLPGLQYNIFIYLLTLFREILSLSEYNK